MDDGERVRVEGEDRVAVPDHGAMTEVDAVEGADGDPPRARR
jgi:hypothetical protein